MTAAENAPLELLSITIKHPVKASLTASHVQKVIFLRTVPTNGKYFFPDNDYVRQVDHIRSY